MLKFIRRFIRESFYAYTNYRKNKILRIKAFERLNKITRQKGISLVDKTLKKKIKAYCKDNFGSASYWPWIALYTELRGEYKEGWIPYDYFVNYILPRINPVSLSQISLSKTYTYKIFGEGCVRPLFVIVDRLVYDSNFKVITRESAQEILKKYNAEVVIKEDGGGNGRRVSFFQSPDVSLDNYIGKGKFEIQPLVKQHEDVAMIYPVSSNSLRVITYLDSEGRVIVKITILKCGANGLRVDNTSRGGRFVYINQEGKPLSDGYFQEGFLFEKRHPESGKAYKDIRVPSVDKVHQICINAHYQFPYSSLIGWDVIVDHNQVPKIIEWNAYKPGIWYHEALCGPLFDYSDIIKKMNL